jgi:hypothetical protein
MLANPIGDIRLSSHHALIERTIEGELKIFFLAMGGIGDGADSQDDFNQSALPQILPCNITPHSTLRFKFRRKARLLPSPESPHCRHSDMANARERGGAVHPRWWMAAHTCRVPSRNIAALVTEYLIGSVEPLLPCRIANCTAANCAERSYQTTGLDIGRERAMFRAYACLGFCALPRSGHVTL